MQQSIYAQLKNINFYPLGPDQHSIPVGPRNFRVLIVVGKGVSIDKYENNNDLKAIQIIFDGNEIKGNFDTNAIGGVIEEHIASHLAVKIDPRHRGINLPFQQLGIRNFDFGASLANNDESIVRDFQEFNDACQITTLLARALQHDSARDIKVYYESGLSSSDVINRLIAKGLDQRWQHSGPLTDLLFGRRPADSVD